MCNRACTPECGGGGFMAEPHSGRALRSPTRVPGRAKIPEGLAQTGALEASGNDDRRRTNSLPQTEGSRPPDKSTCWKPTPSAMMALGGVTSGR